MPAARLTGAHAMNSSLRPHAVFKLHPEAQNNVAQSMDYINYSTDNGSGNRHLVTAFHGTSFENLHSIIRSGLVPASNTKLERTGAAFGNGIYLAKDLAVSYAFSSPAGQRWKGSTLVPEGTRLRCILVCQVEQSSTNSSQLSSSQLSSSSVPEHYLIIDRPDLIRIQYLLLYLDKVQGKSRESRPGSQHERNSSAGPICLFILIAIMIWMCYLQ